MCICQNVPLLDFAVQRIEREEALERVDGARIDRPLRVEEGEGTDTASDQAEGPAREHVENGHKGDDGSADRAEDRDEVLDSVGRGGIGRGVAERGAELEPCGDHREGEDGGAVGVGDGA